MNFVGHVVAAARQHDDPDVWLGAALPDLLPARHLDLAGTTPAVREGVAHHRRADAAFHADPRFLDLCRQVAAALDARGVRRGPARAAAHVGIELLLDGALLEGHEAGTPFRAVWDRLSAPDEVVLGVVDADDRDRWAGWLSSLTGRLDPWRHADEAAVTERLVRLLARRPRLALQEADRLAVTQALADARPSVVALPPIAAFRSPAGDLA